MRSLVNGEDTSEVAEWTPRRWRSGHFSYQEGQHRVVANAPNTVHGNGKLHLPEEINITKTKNSKRWFTSSMEVELAKDVLEVRDGLGNVVNAVVLEPKV